MWDLVSCYREIWEEIVDMEKTIFVFMGAGMILIKEILSHLPVYYISQQNFLGLLFVKEA